MARSRKSKSPRPPPSQSQTRTHIGHSHSHGHGHSHHHHHDNTYLVSANKSDAGVRITRVGLYVNLGMAIAKGAGGYVFNSKALLADAIHSLTDLVSDIMTLATVSWSLKPPTARFPSGYGKVESLGSLGVSGILLTSGMLMGWAALFQLSQMFIPGLAELLEHLGLVGHSHAHDHGTELGPNINAAWLAAGSIAIKEWLYRATLKIAQERKSNVLASNAYHHRVDSLTALVALVLIGASNVFSNAQWLDPVGGLVISLMIIQAGWGNTKESLYELADVGVDESMRNKVGKYAQQVLDEGARDVRLRHVQGVKAGQIYLMDVELGVPGSWSVKETKRVEEALRERVATKVRGVKRLRVRFVPREDVDEKQMDVVLDEFIPADASPRSSPEPEENGHAHNHQGHKH